MAAPAALIIAFVGIVGTLIVVGLRQKFILEVPPKPWAQPVELPHLGVRLRRLRWSLLPFLIAAAVLADRTGDRSVLVILTAGYVAITIAFVVITFRTALQA